MNYNSEFLRSISLEEDPFVGEQPDEVRFYDLDGTEVTDNVAE